MLDYKSKVQHLNISQSYCSQVNQFENSFSSFVFWLFLNQTQLYMLNFLFVFSHQKQNHLSHRVEGQQQSSNESEVWGQINSYPVWERLTFVRNSLWIISYVQMNQDPTLLNF